MLLYIAAAAWSAATGSNFVPSAEASRLLEGKWKEIRTPAHDQEIREVFNFVLNAAAQGWPEEPMLGALAITNKMRESNPTSRLYGNYRWQWGDAAADDTNAVEFSMQYASLAWALYRDRLPPRVREALRSELVFASEGIRRQTVAVSYTNIFIMRAANNIMLGENLDDRAQAQRGYDDFAEWFQYTKANGIHEFDSPTYYGVDLGTLGILANHARSPVVRAQAEAALRLFWAEIGARWFPPFLGIVGPHSRDYNFLTGHGYLDRYIEQEGWMPAARPEGHTAIYHLAHWSPPPGTRELSQQVPRTVEQRWGAHPWEQATVYIGRHFALGSAGAGYGEQDKTICLNFAGGPKQSRVNYLMEAVGDPYGDNKLVTGGGHLKPVHRVPFLMSVQRGPEVLFIASQKMAKLKPAEKPLRSHFFFPLAARLYIGNEEIKFAHGGTPRSVPVGSTVFLRFEDVALALRVLCAEGVGDAAPAIELSNDGEAGGVGRLSIIHAPRLPATGRAVAAFWLRAQEGLDERGFERFMKECLSKKTKVDSRGNELTVQAGQLALGADLLKEERLSISGADVRGPEILSVDGRDLGTPALVLQQ